MENTQKKVIFFMPAMEGGGVEKNLILISNYVSKHINNINLITFDDTFKKYFKKKIKFIYVKEKSKKSYSKYFKYACCIWILLKEYYSNKNILLFTFQANIYGIILAYFLNINVISRSNSSPSGWNKNILKNLIFKFFIKKANAVIVNSREFKKEFKKKFLINAKLIYNPLNKIEILKKSNKRTNISKFFKKKKSLKIINIARLTDQKDQITLIKAIKIIVKKIDVKLYIIGYGSKKKFLLEKIKFYNLNNHIKILGYKSNPFPYLKLSDMFVLTSKFEGLPNVLLESLVLKKFIISTNCPTGPKEILNDGKFGNLFKVGDYRRLAQLILEYSKNKKRYNKKIKLGYASLNRFDYETNCKKYLNLIKKFSQN